jgi:hypothetical protein
MPTTTRSRTTEKSSSVLERDSGLEALGLGIAPGLTGDDRSELVERVEVCLARTLRSEVEVLFWSPIGGIQHRGQGRGPELTGRSQCGQVWRCGASVRAGLKEAVDASWWRTKVKRRKAFLGGASRPLAAMPDSYCWIRGRSGDAVTTKSQRFTQGDLLGPGHGLAGRPEDEEDDGSMAQQKSEDRVVPEGGCNGC